MTPETFAAKTRREGECLVWTGARTKRGYGQYEEGGRKKYVHRWVWEQANGPIPEGAETRHSCDNPPCVLLAHLLMGTHRQNMEDASERGLLARETCPAGHGPEHRTKDGHCRICHNQQSREYRARKGQPN